MRLNPPQAGIVVGILVGIADAIVLLTNFGNSQTRVAVAPFTSLFVIWTWAATGCLTGVVFSSPRLGRLRGVAIALAGPCLLLLARVVTPLKVAAGLSLREVLAIWAVASLVICASFALVRLEQTRSLWKYAAFAAISLALLVWFAADVRMNRVAQDRPARGKHNVALIVLDTVRYDDAMAHMPALAAFAQTATSFDNAWSPAPWTVPTHFALFTGADPWTVAFGEVAEGFQYPGTRLAEHFKNRGYDTAAVFGNPLLNEGSGFGRGFDELTVSLQSRVCRSGIGSILSKVVQHGGPRPPICTWLLAPEVSARAASFVSRGKRPWFIALNYMDAHDPYYVFPECRDASYRKVSRSEQNALIELRPGGSIDPRIAPRVHELYRQAIRCMDRSLGTLLRKLDDGNTVIALVSDHGEQFGEHGYGYHGNSLYRQVLHVPLILKVPGRAPGRVAEPVSTTDLYASLIRAAEPGRARAPIPLFDARWRRPVLSNFDARGRRALHGGFSVVRDHLHFLRTLEEPETLFDYRADPAELSPLPLQEHRPTVDPLREMLLRAARQQTRRVDFDALGYLN